MPKPCKITALATFLCFVALTFASAQQNSKANSSSNSSSSNLSSQDRQFLTEMAKGSQGEVQLSKMVESKTSNSQVKEFAQRMVHDHTALNNQLQQVISKHGMSMPAPMTAEQQQLQSKLQNMSGSQLDRAFMSAEVREHENDVRKVSQHAQAANQMQPSDPDVAELAQEAKPVLQEHLTLAKKVASQVGANTTTSAAAY